MAKKPGKIYVGYEEETITENNLTLLNYTVNKIGGLPNWPPIENVQFPSKCPLCGLHRLLVVQCYAPLEVSIYHRTLYVFACINPNCWNQSESWICIRSQYLDQSRTEASSIVSIPNPDTNLAWCNGADEWDENDNGDTANGNVMSVDNASCQNNTVQRNSDDDESNSYELESVEQALGNLQVFDAHNANMSPVQGAVGAIGVPLAAAELEGGDEPGLITVDTPTNPTRDIELLLSQTAELPQDMRSRLMFAPLQFLPKFIYVEEEWKKPANGDDKIAELLNKYTKDNDIEASGDRSVGGGGEDDVYEEAAPLHGDRMFHAFITRLKNNPGQILRYSREEPPILGAPLPARTPEQPPVPRCHRCGSHLVCEIQLVPELCEALRVLPHNMPLSHLHFLSVLVFTCAQSCWQPADTLLRETVVFQPEVSIGIPLRAITVPICPTNKIAPHRRIANWDYVKGRTFGAFYDLLTPNRPQIQFGPPNDLQEKPQEDDPDDCGEIEDYDESDLSSITPQMQRRRDMDTRFIHGWFKPPPAYLPYPVTTARPQRPPLYPVYKPPTRPPSGGYFGNNVYRPPLQQYPSDSIKPVYENSENFQAPYRPDVVGGSLGHIFGVSPARPTTTNLETTTRPLFRPHYPTRDPSRLSTPKPSTSYPTRQQRPRNINSSGILGSFVDLLFK